ncbi:MAG: DUF5060 domain-containing protein [Psychrobium sp.]
MTISRWLFLSLSLVLMGCGGSSSSQTTTPTPEPTPPAPPIIAPEITNAVSDKQTTGRYQKIEWQLDINASYDNPFDQRQVSVDARFISPNSETHDINGYWDIRRGWIVRFAPNQIGNWKVNFSVTTPNQQSAEVNQQFNVTASNEKGIIQVANQIDSAYSPRYFMHQDGSEFYGIGHSDAFSIFRNSDTADRLLARMKTANENYFVWWPFFYFSMVETNYNNFNLQNTEMIDEVIEKTEQAGLTLVFTLWDHSQLRDNNHPWSDGRWHRNNGFNQLTNANEFFTDEEAWQWQQNLYRYIIARWGHSSAIAMWQTVSEIDGTNAFENANNWHQKINDYFKENDPYRHPITASMAGDKTWPEGHAVMDVPQVHIYRDLLTDKDDARSPAKVIESASIIANYTSNMWQAQAKPNWIGEFGVINHPVNQDEDYYPEVFHNALWSALASGAAMTPAEWNDFSDWGQVTAEMTTTLQHFATFVDRLSLAKWNPSPLNITSPNGIKAWGIASEQGGMIWLQDTTLQSESISNIRLRRQTTAQLTIELNNMPAGDYQVAPYNTQLGEFLAPLSVTCQSNTPCLIAVPEFVGDVALLIKET